MRAVQALARLELPLPVQRQVGDGRLLVGQQSRRERRRVAHRHRRRREAVAQVGRPEFREEALAVMNERPRGQHELAIPRLQDRGGSGARAQQGVPVPHHAPVGGQTVQVLGAEQDQQAVEEPAARVGSSVITRRWEAVMQRMAAVSRKSVTSAAFSSRRSSFPRPHPHVQHPRRRRPRHPAAELKSSFAVAHALLQAVSPERLGNRRSTPPRAGLSLPLAVAAGEQVDARRERHRLLGQVAEGAGVQGFNAHGLRSRRH